ncbi:probable inactive ATP-dependent zinc metalloprotease FTSHI 4, chloroplastic isoform X2 [Cryptomeria japonica]|uniref:probable inactive ATP-dependent zinc metalloprotease FTSHI 4, chloroplastic isoform X2 n=1 Tax=Cryptomeria japonica TaxID=3369 RepID=UPI0027DA962F|nr:probable inactive ATP-dependent zinc metalloprotease FTSHI 4, chloroplastic isoform X2 [Cryptomeria japonica]
MASQAYSHQMHLSTLKMSRSLSFQLLNPTNKSCTVCKINPYRITLNKAFIRMKHLRKIRVIKASNAEAEITNTNSEIVNTDTQLVKSEGDAQTMVRQVFEKLREEEKQRVEELDEIERKANLQFEREYVMASSWGKKLLKLQGKLKGTPCDPENSHDISFSEFGKLLDKKQVNYMEYGDLGQSVAVILPHYKDGKAMDGRIVRSLDDSEREIVFRRHVVKRMPVDCGNDIWQKLHQQLINVEIVNTNTIPFQIFAPFALAVLWAMRLGLAYFLYLRLDSFLRKIYSWDNPERPRFKEEDEPSAFEKKSELGAFAESRARFIAAEESTGVTFDDFAGHEYVKRELQEVVRLLKKTGEFEGTDVYCPKGVLLFGPPGTGKTLLAKAIAGEAGVPFFAVNGSEFVEMFAGVAASRVMDLWARARRSAPSIIFIDEIDAIGAERGGPDVGGGGAEREAGLMQILTELDGFKVSTEQVLLVGATNRKDLLDPALLRKGRIDKIINVGLPTEEGRLAILKVHARNKAFRSEEEKEKLLKEVAEETVDASGAELANILNEAGILCVRKDKDFIEREDLVEAMSRQEGEFETGLEDHVEFSLEVKMQVAYREAAIAVLECYYPNPYRPFVKTDILVADNTANMEYMEPRHNVFARKADYVNSIVRACAPRIIEEEIFGMDHLSWLSGAALSEAGVYAEKFILQTGLSVLGKIYYRKEEDVMVHLHRKIQALRDEYVRYGVEKCTSVLREYRSAVENIADILLEKNEIMADEIWDIFRKAPRIPQVVASLRHTCRSRELPGCVDLCRAWGDSWRSLNCPVDAGEPLCQPKFL